MAPGGICQVAAMLHFETALHTRTATHVCVPGTTQYSPAIFCLPNTGLLLQFFNFFFSYLSVYDKISRLRFLLKLTELLNA